MKFRLKKPKALALALALAVSAAAAAYAQEPPAAAEGYKQYRVSLDGHPFSVEAGEGAFAMDGPITVGAPPAQQHGWTAAGTSNVPFEQEIAVSVEVGGTRGMYRAAEASAKAANIVWSVKTLPLEP